MASKHAFNTGRTPAKAPQFNQKLYEVFSLLRAVSAHILPVNPQIQSDFYGRKGSGQSLARPASLLGLVLFDFTTVEEHLAAYPQCAETKLLLDECIPR